MPNAIEAATSHFNISIHEAMGAAEVEQTVAAMLKVD
jgi:hypothetical protein